MSINAIALYSYSSPQTVSSQFSDFPGTQPSTPVVPEPSVHVSISSIHPPIGSFSFKIDGESNATTIADAGEEYAATIPGLGTVNGPNEAAVDAAINFRISELA
jgi:hypothetical protein